MNARDRKRQQEVIQFWRDSAARDWAAAEDTFKLGHYHWSLFIAHLAIEKLLKALVEQNKEITPPKIHDLEQLAKMAGLGLSDQFRDWFSVITRFNMEARYSEEKLSFYRKATKSFTMLWLGQCKEVYEWLNDQFA